MTKVWKDAEGLYVIAGGYVARPGSVAGRGHALRMDDGGLSEGETVVARHRGGTQLTTVRLADGRMTHWHHEGPERDGGLVDPPSDAVWDDAGRRDFSVERARRTDIAVPSAPRRVRPATVPAVRDVSEGGTLPEEDESAAPRI